MTIAIYILLGFFALMGNARIGLFSLNRLVFGEKHESDRLKWGLLAIPIVLLLLAPLYWIFVRDFRDGQLTLLGWSGAIWLSVTVGAGIYWLIDRGWHTTHPKQMEGVRSDEPDLIRIRKAHIPFASLRRLGAHNDVYDLEITHHEIIIPDLPASFDGYRIAFLTDTHVTSFMRRGFYRLCVEETVRRQTDLVLLGGDFVSWQKHIPLMTRVLLDGLEAPDGVYAVLGNHDYWSDADSVVAAMSAKGVEFIINRSVRLQRGNDVIDLVGIDEIYRGDPDVETAFRQVTGKRPCIAVSHHPDIIDELGGQRVDLLLSGHTHGGQIRLPFLGAIVVPSKHEGLYDAGFHREGDVLLYVSRGLGSVPPVRILCRPELATFTLVRERRSEETLPGLQHKPLKPERRN